MELQAKDYKAQKVKEQSLKEGWEEIKEILYHQGLSYVPKILNTKAISQYYNNPLAGHFGTKKTQELVAQKYY